MHRFRRSGSFVRFFVEGEPADVSDLSLLKALERERFKPIEGSATDDESVGWVTRGDLSGARFEPEDVIAEHFLVFALRIDRKKVPATLLRIHASADLRAAASGGKPLGRAQKKEILEETKRKLMARALPSVSITDCIWNPRRGVLYVFATGGATLERVARHFRESFRRSLAPATPSIVAERLKLPDPLRKVMSHISPADLVGSSRAASARAQEVEA
ncbi:MAG: recombination-associated protein RdgC [Planctomycetes bacterium]|nr:recombination-associated protein RdgC [Planctomycetota bacterium]